METIDTPLPQWPIMRQTLVLIKLMIYPLVGSIGTYWGRNQSCYIKNVLGKDMQWIIFFFLLGATTDNLGPGVLYQVKASYKYQAEDVDELNFEVGEVIDVVEYDDPEEQVNKEVANESLYNENYTFQMI